MIVVSHEAVCNQGPETTSKLFNALGINQPDRQASVAAFFKPEALRERAYPECNPALRDEAYALYAELTKAE